MRRISRKLAVLVALGLSVGVLAVTTTPATAAPIAYTTLITDGCQLATVDLATGAITPLPAGPSGAACVDDLAVAPDGTVYGISDFIDDNNSATLVTFNPTTGAPVTTVAFTGSFTQSFTAHGGIAVDGTGVMYASFTTNEAGCSDFGNTIVMACLYRIDPTTAAATLIGPSGANLIRDFWLTTNCDGAMLTGEQTELNGGGAVEDVTPQAPETPGTEGDASAQAEPSDPVEDFADDVGALVHGLRLSSVDEATGTVTSGPILGIDDTFGIEWASPNGPLYGIGEIENNGEIPHVFVIDPATGAATIVADLDAPQIGGVENLAMALTCPAELVVNFTG